MEHITEPNPLNTSFMEKPVEPPQRAFYTQQPTATPTKAEAVLEGEVKTDMETSTPVLPVTVPVNGGYGYKEGLEGKDAAFITELHSATRSQDLSNQINQNGFNATIQSAEAKYQNAVQVLESKFQNERAVKEIEIASERLAREQLAQMNAIRSELSLMIQSESDRTRDLIRDQERRQKDGDLLLLKLKDLLPTTP